MLYCILTVHEEGFESGERIDTIGQVLLSHVIRTFHPSEKMIFKKSTIASSSKLCRTRIVKRVDLTQTGRHTCVKLVRDIQLRHLDNFVCHRFPKVGSFRYIPIRRKLWSGMIAVNPSFWPDNLKSGSILRYEDPQFVLAS